MAVIVNVDVSSGALALIGAALLGAIVAGTIQAALAYWDRRIKGRVAAMAVLGDAALTEGIFKLLAEHRSWFSYDFGPALETWIEYRGDFATTAKVWDWALVDSFYSNLARSAAIARPGEPVNAADLRVGEEQIRYAGMAFETAFKRVARTRAAKERVFKRINKRLVDAGLPPYSE